MNVVFFGSSTYVIPIIEVLRKNFDLALVLTTERNTNDAVPNYCINNKIQYLSVSSLKDPLISSRLSFISTPIAVLADFGLIIPEEILNLFPKGIINLHPSLLPKYRGPTPVQNAILNGDKTTGISIMKLDDKVDHGPILRQEKEEILDTDTAESLYKRLFEKGAYLLPKTIGLYLGEKLIPVAQNHKLAIFTTPLTRQSGYVEISKIKDQISKIKLDRMIKAYYPWPGVWFKTPLRQGSGGQAKLKIIKLLPFGRLQVEGKKPMSYKDFLNGYPETREALNVISPHQD
jgi:methionyl-tRNA formyltransferase